MKKKLLFITLIIAAKTSVAQTTDFSYTSGENICLPADIHFTQTSSGTPTGYLWDFGNGARSNSANPVAIYDAAGTYTVKLITVYYNTTAQRTKTIVIHPSITANFTSDRNYSCTPGVFNFTITGAGSGTIQNYMWNFGDSTANVTSTSTSISHNYSSYGAFTVTLTATGTSGCVATSDRVINIVEPEITGSVTSVTGCIPMTAHFSSIVNLTQGSSITNYLWNFGDGTTSSSASLQNSHNYTTAGAFSPSLTITTGEGCTKTFIFDSVYYGIAPTHSSAYSPDSIYCGSEAPLFIAKATNANRYDWDFGGGSITSVTDTITSHKYTTLGLKNITVTPYFNGCAGTAVHYHIKIIGVIAKFNYKNTCNDKKTFQFQNASLGHVSTLLWNMGDQATSSTPSFNHTYPQTGTFPAKLLITDNITGCLDSSVKNIYTANPILKNPDQTICINTDTHFEILNSYANPDITYTWNVVGTPIGPAPEDSVTVHAIVLGHFNTNNVILDNGSSHYCADTITLDHPLTVRGPQLDFTVPESICINTALTVVNLSHPFQADDSVNLWYWNFGKVSTNDTAYQPQPYTYTLAKAYYVKLTAVDIHGCMDTLRKRIHVRPMPFLWIIPKHADICQGQSSTMIGYTSDSISWAPAIPNFCTTCDTTTVAPSATTTFYATSTNSFGCVASDSAVVQVATAFTASPVTPESFICAGEKVKLEVAPANKKIVWTPAESLSVSSDYNPIASPIHSTVYTATLTDSAGCFTSTAEIKLNVKSKPTVDAGPDKIYPYHSDFTFTPIYSSNIRSWLWTPADSLSCTSCPTPSGVATGKQTYTVTVVSDSGCVASDNVTISVECQGADFLLPTAFTPNNDNLNDLFHPLTRGIKTIAKFVIYNRQGQLVYELNNYTPGKEKYGWDGKFKGKDQESAGYVYIAEGICEMGQTVISKGSFLLIR